MSIKVRYYENRNGRGFWAPRGWVKDLTGFGPRPLGPDGPAAWAAAKALYDEALKARRTGDAPAPCEYPPGSLGHFWHAWTKGRTFARKAPRTREEYVTAWLKIGPELGSLSFAKLTPARIEQFRDDMDERHTQKVRHRSVAKLSSLLIQAKAHGLIAENPCNAVRNDKPRPRTQSWTPQEVETLAATARAMGHAGLALALRLIYECGFAPVDARLVCGRELRRDRAGWWLAIDRKKTGVDGVWPISGDLAAGVIAYRDGLGVELMDDAPILRRPDGLPWRDESHFAKDFGAVRAKAFGRQEKRRAMDIRRTYNIELDLGGASREERAAAMANGLDRDSGLDATYTPPTLEKARRTAKKRAAGQAIRRRMGERKEAGRG